jgi:predicted O-methyltransferase YrrM
MAERSPKSALEAPETIKRQSRMKDLLPQIRDIVEREILGRGVDSFNIDTISWLAAAVQSSDYAQRYMQRAPRIEKWQLLEYAVSEAKVDGLFLEFGVHSGATITAIARAKANATVYGFDSFEGLPEQWANMAPKGHFKKNELPVVPENVQLIVGWFDRTLPTFLDQHPGKAVSFVHIDCDLYSSTQAVLSQIKDRVVAGTIIVFDEYFHYPGWRDHEFKAFQEFVHNSHLSYSYIAVNSGHQQVAVRITVHPGTA